LPPCVKTPGTKIYDAHHQGQAAQNRY